MKIAKESLDLHARAALAPAGRCALRLLPATAGVSVVMDKDGGAGLVMAFETGALAAAAVRRAELSSMK